MTDVPRRAFLIGGSALLLVACAPAGPGAVTIVAQGTAGMNPGPDGADRPLTLQVLQLRGSGAFDGADFFGLQTASATLGGDLVKADTITLAPGGKATKTIALEATTAIIAVVAGFRDPAGKQFRAKSSVSPTDSVTFALDVTASGIKLTPM
ncbi:type VI secretion system lipoprotein TssJ [Tabrizicola sp.]|jgi:type VI secretion system protein VasD|uniref:type VI secretion system lipoprotein TssJ n=1 Tax=Tabrizicola sp. TaxID=2005166 RepID=UPI0035AF3BCF